MNSESELSRNDVIFVLLNRTPQYTIRHLNVRVDAARGKAPIYGASVSKIIRKFATRVILRASIEWRNRVSFECKMRSRRAFRFPYSFFRAPLAPRGLLAISFSISRPVPAPPVAGQKDQRPICQSPDTGSPERRNLVKLFRRPLPRHSGSPAISLLIAIKVTTGYTGVI